MRYDVVVFCVTSGAFGKGAGPSLPQACPFFCCLRGAGHLVKPDSGSETCGGNPTVMPQTEALYGCCGSPTHHTTLTAPVRRLRQKKMTQAGDNQPISMLSRELAGSWVASVGEEIRYQVALFPP